jgi:transaldolase
MNRTTEKLHGIGQSIWLDNITHRLLASGTLLSYIRELSVTGLTSNPTIFDHAIKNSDDYDDVIRRKLDEGKSGEELFFELALEDLRQAADLFRPVYDRTDGVDGWVSLEVSPLLAHNTTGTLAAACALHNRAARPNLFIKIPGTSEGLPAIEEAIFRGVPVNVTLLFSGAQYVAAAEAYMRGVERRMAAGLNPDVGSVASLFVSRWDVAVAQKLPESCATSLASQSPGMHMRYIARCWIRRGGNASRTLELALNAFFGRAQEPRIPKPRKSCTSRPSPCPPPLTRCLRQP